MPQAQIPFVNQQASGSDRLSGASPVSMNVILEPNGAVRRRPGIVAHPSAPASVIDANGLVGLHQSLDGSFFSVGAAGAERPIYKIAGGSAVSLSPVGTPTGVRGALRPTFAETEMLLVIAGGLDMQKVELAPAVSSRLGGSPPLASHVIANSQRIIANDTTLDRTKVRYSGTAQGTVTYAGHEQWLVGAGTAGFFTAEARPDPIVAIGESTNEMFVWGTETTEVYSPDSVLRFARVAAMENGLGAPASVVKADQVFIWLDQQKRFVAGNARDFEVISGPIQRTLDEISNVSDCFGYRVRVGPCDALVWTFPSDGRSFAFQQGSGWGQWSGWDGSNWSRMVVNGAAGVDAVVTTTGRMGQFSSSAQTDLGEPIRAFVESGAQNHKTDAMKDCKRVMLALRRGETSEVAGQQGALWYSDRPGHWELAGPIDLGGSGETDIVVEFPSLGSYRRRNWRVEFSGSDEFVLLGASEEFEVTEY